MAETTRIDSLSIFLNGTEGKMLLAETYKGVMENFSKEAVSTKFKNTRLSGTPDGGTMIAKRLAMNTVQEYGTARAAGEGKKLKGIEVPVQIDRNKEIVIEIESKDISLIGIDGLMENIKKDMARALVAYLDRDFFGVAKTKGTQFKAPAAMTGINNIVEKAIVTLEETKNDYVDGFDRQYLNIIMSPSTYSDFRLYLDTTNNSNVNTAAGDFGIYHGIPCYSSNRLPEGVDFLVMVSESVAQPILPSELKVDPVPLSNATALMLFPNWGCEAVMPDGVFWCNMSEKATS